MESISQAVIKSGADLGVIFDTDVDRSALVDKNGQAINRNNLIALISSIILKEHPGSVIVTDSITSDGLTLFIEEMGGNHHRYKRGYKNVINESIRLNNEGSESWLAIETSGHAALKENYFLDDGAFLIAKILIEAARLYKEGKDISSLILNLEQPAESKEYRYKITCPNFGIYGQNVLEEISKKTIGVDGWELVLPNYEGVRVKCNTQEENGWFLLRMSLHNPVMPLNIESNLEGGCELIFNKLKTLLENYKDLTLS